MFSSNGLTWSPEWETPYESAFSRLMKIAAANCLRPAELYSLFVSKSVYDAAACPPRYSLIFLSWTRNRIVNSFAGLDRLVAHGSTFDTVLWERCASDRSFRYCPACLEQGTHYAEFQFRALAACPIHGVKLVDRCPHCTCLLPQVDFSSVLLLHPFACGECGQILPEGPTFQNLFRRTDRYKQIQAFSSVHASVRLQVRWEAPDLWVQQYTENRESVERSELIGGVLARLLKVDEVLGGGTELEAQAGLRVELHTPEPKRPSEQSFQDLCLQRFRILEAIERRLLGTYVRHHQDHVSTSLKLGELLFQRTLSCCAMGLAWRIWYERYWGEASWSGRSRNECMKRIAHSFLDAEVAYSDDAWRHKVEMSFHGAMRTVRRWLEFRECVREQSSSLDDAGIWWRLARSSITGHDPQVSSLILTSSTSRRVLVVFGPDEAEAVDKLSFSCWESKHA